MTQQEKNNIINLIEEARKDRDAKKSKYVKDNQIDTEKILSPLNSPDFFKIDDEYNAKFVELSRALLEAAKFKNGDKIQFIGCDYWNNHTYKGMVSILYSGVLVSKFISSSTNNICYEMQDVTPYSTTPIRIVSEDDIIGILN
jgi:hypothetical protein